MHTAGRITTNEKAGGAELSLLHDTTEGTHRRSHSSV
jgi:hypothetical protein